MDRRRFLASTGIALLGGCTFVGTEETPTATPVDPPADPTDTPTDTPRSGDDRDPTAERLQERRVVDFETVPLTVALYGSRRINDRVTTTYGISEPATDDSPAVVHALVENRGSFEETFKLRRIPGFDDPPRVRTSGDRAGVYLAPTENHDLAASVPAVTQDAEDRWRLADGPRRDWLPSQLSLAPEESVLGEYYLVGRSDPSEQPLVAGEYTARYQRQGFTVAVWNTDAPGPDRAASDHPDAAVPPLPRADDMAWYHEAGPSTEVYLEPSAETVAAPVCVEFELYNHSHERLSGNPYRWGLYKLDGGEWFRIEPWLTPSPLSWVQPGERDESELSLFHGAPIDCEDGRAVGHLGGGRYAYHVGYGRDGETHAALLEFEAPPVRPSPDDGVTAERDGDEVVVTTPVWNDAEHPPNAEIVFERTDGAAERRLVPEQLFRRPMRGFRNGLLHAEDGVQRVVLRTDRHVVGDTVGYDDLETTVEYGGETFHATGEDPLKD